MTAHIQKIKAHSVSLNKSTTALQNLYKDCLGKAMPELTGNPRERFARAISYLKEAFDTNALAAAKFLDDFDIKTTGEIEEILSEFDNRDESIEVDDISPNIFFTAIEEAIVSFKVENEEIKVIYSNFLRQIFDNLAEKQNRKFNVGMNRHLLRTTQWVLEYIESYNSIEEKIILRLIYASNGKSVSEKKLFNPKNVILKITP
jgi:hypothetical protein